MSFIKIVSAGYTDINALKDVSNYGANGERCMLLDGAGVCDCNVDRAVKNMNFIKWLYDKEGGKQLVQLIINVYRYQHIKNRNEFEEKYQMELSYVKLVSIDIENMLLDMGFQSNVYLHEDTDYIHLHFVINSVNFRTGAKMHNIYEIEKQINSYLKQNYSNLQWKG